jgi:hypothetical protein
MRSTSRLIAVLGLGVVACGGDGDEQATTGSSEPTATSNDPTDATITTTISTSGADSGSSTGGDPTTVSTTMTTTTEADSSSSDTSGASTFDLGVQPDVGVVEGCTAVDFLFVIDDSLSMEVHQANLIANFPAFIDGIEESLASVESFHVGVVATDPFAGNPGACILIGALVTSTTGAGANSSQAECGPYADGFNYMTDADDLDASFACAAQVGTSGSGSERPMDAVVAALDGSLAGAGGCNEGFLRDDALLVVVVITDEYDGEGDPEPGNGEEPATSVGGPMDWYDAVVAAKGGIAENAVALAIVNYEGGACEPAELGFDGVNMVSWAEMFGSNGFVGGLCEKDYGPMFAEATGVIAEACENFVPEG